MENQKTESPVVDSKKKRKSLKKKLKQYALTTVCVISLGISGIIGAGAHMIFRTPDPIPVAVIPPCPEVVQCPDVVECPGVVATSKDETTWYGEVWDAITPGKKAIATQAPAPILVPVPKITTKPAPAVKLPPSPEPRSIFKSWLQDDLQTWFKKVFGWKEKTIIKEKEVKVIIEKPLSSQTKQELDKHLASIVELTTKMANKDIDDKNRKEIQKQITSHMEKVVELLETDSKAIFPIMDLKPAKNSKV